MKRAQLQQESVLSLPEEHLMTSQRKGSSYTPILVALLIISSYLLGMLTTKVQYLEKKSTGGGAVQAAQTDTTQVAQQPDTTAPQPGEKVDVAVGHLPIRGDENAKVTLVEFSDFECPFCERLYKDTMKQIKTEYIDTGKVKLAYRHYPLSFHPNAQKAAEASECANDQNKFWEFHDALFENYEEWANKDSEDALAKFNDYAEQLALDSVTFTSCVKSEKHKETVEKDQSEGNTAGVNGTPATFVNGQLVSGAMPYESFKTIIEKELSS